MAAAVTSDAVRDEALWAGAVPEGHPLLLMLDFDGTLVAIAPAPDAVVVPPGLSEVLIALKARGHAVWVVTGRAVPDVEERLPVMRDHVIGLHGLAWPHEPLPPRAPLLDGAARQVRAALARSAIDDGLLRVEDKRLSVAFHYRSYPEAEWSLVRGVLERTVREMLAGPSAALRGGSALDVLTGHCVVELRPRAASKVNAVARLVRGHPEHFPVFIGDDVTDEEAFAALANRGLTVRVGAPTVATIAKRRARGPDEVLAGLCALAARG